MKPIKYIGHRESHIDNLYGTRMIFLKGESRLVPDDIYAKMLKHPDVFAEGDILTAGIFEPVPLKNEAEDTQDLRDSINNLDSYDALNAIAANDYGQKLDKRKSIQTLRTEVIALVDQFGTV